ncbi:sec-independent protein translocase protein TATA, chloroplastic [Quillaja saponaria]|uniref:Sec-independent protein translocase protein TATA, chloroplastic n=1 Tax=Quillaja saponaria TaxID=32244 RepID=A0AAD7Q259_QUISA|nr:sec-independent protein translocase protein TATA, chloroplastic [Quillaja saponaria]
MEIASVTLTFSSSIPRLPISGPLNSTSSTFFANYPTSPFLKKTRISLSNTLVVGRTRTRAEERKRGLTCNALFGLGVPELAVIAGVAALVFGPKQLPEVGRSIGKTVKSFQQDVLQTCSKVLSCCWQQRSLKPSSKRNLILN